MPRRGPAVLCFTLLAFSSGTASAQPKAAGQLTAAEQKRAATLTVATGLECLQCHEEVVNAFGRTAHGKSTQFLKGTQSATCNSCHGDPNRHKVSGNPSQILTPNKIPEAQASEMCLTCHSQEQTHANWRGSPHDRRNVTCVSCHNEHHPKSKEKLLAKVNDIELCVNCHKDKRKAILQRSTHLFRTEHRDVKVGCASCHNPHGGETRTMLVASSTNELCYNCHAEKRGPFLWEHAPGRSDCNACHVPHGSNNPNMLKARVTVLCQKCHMHMLWRHQTVAGYDISSFAKGCVNCHSQVHGSNHPNGKTFIH